MTNRKGTATRAFEVILDHNANDGVWYVHVADEPRAHTYGRTLASARANIAEVIELWFELEPGTYTIVETIHGFDLAQDAIGHVVELRRWLAEAQDAVSHATREAAEILVNKEGLSLRDAGNLLDLSHQRIDQLLRGD